MALEDRIALLIAALEKNTETLIANAIARDEVLKLVKASDTDAAAKTAEKASTGKTASKAAKPAKAEDSADAADGIDAETAAELKELVARYFDVERSEERQARQEKVRALLNHEKIRKAGTKASDKPSLTNIAPGSVDLFRSQMALLTKKGDLTTPAETEDALTT